MSRQDQDVPEPRIRLLLLLQLLRIAAARRGHATVSWSGQGFTYRLYAVRAVGPDLDPDVEIDHDPDADPAMLERLREALYPNP